MNPLSDHESPELVRLFETYTAGPHSIGAKLTALTSASTANDPLIVATSTDIVLCPGGGKAPEIEGFRMSTRGFKELAGISHHGPAVASLIRMRELDPGGALWRSETQRLIESTRAARLANSVELWRDRIAVAAYRGREQRIAELVDYSCVLTERYLERALRTPETFTAADMREHYLEARGDAVGATVPMNAVMIATFFLVGMDTGHRVMTWFDRHAIDWSRAMALIVGRQGRPTAGVTWTSNSVCAMILASSRYRLSLDRLYIAPHGPSFKVSELAGPEAVRAFEEPLRQIWAHTRTVSDLGPLIRRLSALRGRHDHAPDDRCQHALGRRNARDRWPRRLACAQHATACGAGRPAATAVGLRRRLRRRSIAGERQRAIQGGGSGSGQRELPTPCEGSRHEAMTPVRRPHRRAAKSANSRRQKMRYLKLVLFAAGLSASLAPAWAQPAPWPSRPIKIVTPTPAGIGSDVFARVYADKLGKALKVPVIVDSAPGRCRPSAPTLSPRPRPTATRSCSRPATRSR